MFRLSDHAKHLFNELGSALVQNLRFRDNWYFVGQKGIPGFGDREEVSSATVEQTRSFEASTTDFLGLA